MLSDCNQIEEREREIPFNAPVSEENWTFRTKTHIYSEESKRILLGVT